MNVVVVTVKKQALYDSASHSFWNLAKFEDATYAGVSFFNG